MVCNDSNKPVISGIRIPIRANVGDRPYWMVSKALVNSLVTVQMCAAQGWEFPGVSLSVRPSVASVFIYDICMGRAVRSATWVEGVVAAEVVA